MAKEILTIRLHLETTNMTTLEVSQGDMVAIINDTETGEGSIVVPDSATVTGLLGDLLAAIKTEVESEIV